ncbi:MAG: hypothetical protein ACRD51_06105 [Candidatus Acidiferrum sp.]
MNRPAERVGQALFPEKVRQYLTFRLMTAYVAVLAMGNLAFGLVYKPELPPEIAARIHSPVFLALQNGVLAVGLWLVYRTRKKKGYYLLRVVFHGMLLAGVVGEMLLFMWHLRG